MRITMSPASAALALAVLALALGAPAASAIQLPPAAAPAVSSGAVEASGRCMLWRHRCRELYPAGGWRFRRCIALHGCG